MLGWIIGLGGAVLMGIAIYRGVLKINLGLFFRYTGILLIIVAAGILAYGIHDLQEAGFETDFIGHRSAVPPDSWYGTLLKGIFNFSPNTTWLQAVAWVLYVGIVLTLFLRPVKVASTPPPSPAPATRSGA